MPSVPARPVGEPTQAPSAPMTATPLNVRFPSASTLADSTTDGRSERSRKEPLVATVANSGLFFTSAHSPLKMGPGS